MNRLRYAVAAAAIVPAAVGFNAGTAGATPWGGLSCYQGQVCLYQNLWYAHDAGVTKSNAFGFSGTNGNFDTSYGGYWIRTEMSSLGNWGTSGAKARVMSERNGGASGWKLACVDPNVGVPYVGDQFNDLNNSNDWPWACGDITAWGTYPK